MGLLETAGGYHWDPQAIREDRYNRRCRRWHIGKNIKRYGADELLVLVHHKGPCEWIRTHNPQIYADGREGGVGIRRLVRREAKRPKLHRPRSEESIGALIATHILPPRICPSTVVRVLICFYPFSCIPSTKMSSADISASGDYME